MDYKNYLRLASVAMMISVTGCDNSDRIAKLEKENAELRAKLQNASTVVSDFELAEKCNRDAKMWHEDWLRKNWDSKKTMFSDYTSHYNKESNSCFIMVEHHAKSSFGEDGSWSNVMELWDLVENSRYASIQEDNLVHSKPEYNVGYYVAQCEAGGKECKTLAEWNNFTRPYMSK